MTLTATIAAEIPTIDRIASEGLRERTLEAVATAVEESEYERPSDLPGLARLADRIDVDNAQHTDAVAALPREIGAWFDGRAGMAIDLDTVTAGAVCHSGISAGGHPLSRWEEARSPWDKTHPSHCRPPGVQHFTTE